MYIYSNITMFLKNRQFACTILIFLVWSVISTACSDNNEVPSFSPTFEMPDEFTQAANQQNKGLAVSDSLYLYYCLYNSRDNLNYLMKQDKESGETSVIMKNESITHLHIGHNNLYCMTSSTEGGDTIWSISSTHTQQRTSIFTAQRIPDVAFLKNGIYRTTLNDELYYTSYDGMTNRKLLDGCHRAPTMEYDGYVYYLSQRNILKRYHMENNTDEKIYEVNSADGVESFVICKDKIYLINRTIDTTTFETSEHLCRLNPDGSGIENLATFAPSSIMLNVWKDKLFMTYNGQTEDDEKANGLYEIETGSWKNQLILAGEFDRLCLTEDNRIILKTVNDNPGNVLTETDFSGSYCRPIK